MSSEAKKSPVESVVQWLETRGFQKIRAVSLEGYEDPSTFTRQRDEASFTPMLTARKNERKYYFEIAEKSVKKSKERVIQKWALLAELAELRNGEFQVFAPYGMFSFTRRILKNHGIEAEIVKI